MKNGEEWKKLRQSCVGVLLIEQVPMKDHEQIIAKMKSVFDRLSTFEPSILISQENGKNIDSQFKEQAFRLLNDNLLIRSAAFTEIFRLTVENYHLSSKRRGVPRPL